MTISHHRSLVPAQKKRLLPSFLRQKVAMAVAVAYTSIAALGARLDCSFIFPFFTL
jgi:hypothetical protein